MGELIIYTGPMKCGKTTKLIEKFNEVKNINAKTFMFKPTIDDRFDKDAVVSRNGISVQAQCINSVDDLINYSYIGDNLFIDEFQFLGGHISTIIRLLNKGKNIYIAGLNLTSEKKPFGLMGELMCLATEVNIMKGNCDSCKKEGTGTFTFCEEHKTDDILVGDAQYLCVCNKCYIERTSEKRCI